MAQGNGRSKTLSRKNLVNLVKSERPRLIDEQSLHERPKVRGDCEPGGINEQRPCPWLSCKYHLYLDADKETGSIKVNFPHVKDDFEKMTESCSLDIADRGGITLIEIGKMLNVTRERIRQIESRAIRAAKQLAVEQECVDEDEVRGIELRNANHLSELRVSGRPLPVRLAPDVTVDGDVPAAPTDDVDEIDNELLDSDPAVDYG
jgi:hypothetical protein